MSDSKQDPPKTNGASALVIVSVVGGLMSPVYVMVLGLASDISAQEQAINDLRSKVIGPAAGLTEKVDGLGKAVTELDRTLQMEIAAAADRADVQLKSLDDKIQLEIDAADNESAGRHDVQSEQIRSLEREIFKEEQ